jgi:hypothetical protein
MIRENVSVRINSPGNWYDGAEGVVEAKYQDRWIVKVVRTREGKSVKNFKVLVDEEKLEPINVSEKTEVKTILERKPRVKQVKKMVKPKSVDVVVKKYGRMNVILRDAYEKEGKLVLVFADEKNNEYVWSRKSWRHEQFRYVIDRYGSDVEKWLGTRFVLTFDRKLDKIIMKPE